MLNKALALSLSPNSGWPAQVEKLLKEGSPFCSKNIAMQSSAEAQLVKEYARKLSLDYSKKGNLPISKEEWRRSLLSRYSWINENNVSTLYSQTQYQLYK
ncbi:hypothetical protein ACWAU3_13520 [Shewanella sp. JL219SE-S6]